MILALVTVAVVSVNAQKSESKKFTFGVGPVVSFPSGDFSTGYGVGFGGEVEAIMSISNNFEGFAQAGYSSFTGKTISGFKVSSVGFIPVLVGARYSKDFIGGLGLGYGSFSGGGSSSGGFTFSPQAGYNFGKIEALAHYTSVSTSGGSTNFMGIKVFYKF